MTKNMSSTDRKIRTFAVAPVLIIVGVLAGPTGWLALAAYALAAVMLATAAVGSCPLYSLVGMSTLGHGHAHPETTGHASTH